MNYPTLQPNEIGKRSDGARVIRVSPIKKHVNNVCKEGGIFATVWNQCKKIKQVRRNRDKLMEVRNSTASKRISDEVEKSTTEKKEPVKTITEPEPQMSKEA